MTGAVAPGGVLLSAGLAIAAVLLVAAPARRADDPTAPRAVRAGPRWVVPLGAAAVALLAPLSHLHLAVGLVLTGAALAATRLRRRAQRVRDAGRRREQVVAYCEALVGELQAGQPASRSLERAAGAWADAHPVAAASRLGADVAGAMRRLAEAPGAESMRRLAAAWELCSATGSGLAVAATKVLETARADQATARLVQAELASARATARLVCVLPVLVLLAASGIGARPWHFLLATPVGVGCLATGVAMMFAGLTWIERIAESADRGDG